MFDKNKLTDAEWELAQKILGWRMPTPPPPPPAPTVPSPNEPAGAAGSQGIPDLLKPIEKSMRHVAAAAAVLRQTFDAAISSATPAVKALDSQAKALAFLSGQGEKNAEVEGKVSKSTLALRDACASAQKSMVATSAALTATFATLHRLSGAANPGLMRAWDGALGMVSARIANSLLPEMSGVIDAVQDVGDWFDSLSEPAKKIISYAAVGSTALAGLATGLGALWPAIAITKAALGRKAAAEREEGAAALSAAASVSSAAATRRSATGGGALVGMAGRAGILAAVAEFAWSTATVLNPHEADVESQRHRNDSRRAVPATEAEREEAFKGSASSWIATAATLGLNQLGFHFSDRKSQYEQYQRGTPEEKRRIAEAMARREHQVAEEIRAGGGLGAERRAAEHEGRAGIFERMAQHGVVSREDIVSDRRLRHLHMQASSLMKENRPHYSALADARQTVQANLLSMDKFQLDELKQSRKMLENILKEIRREEQKRDARAARERGMYQH